MSNQKSSAVFDAITPIIYLGSAAAVQLIAASAYFKSKPDILTTFLFFMMTAGIYLLNRITDKEDKFNNLARWQFFNGSFNRTVFWGFLSGTAITGPVIVSLLLEQFRMAMLFGIIAACGVIYSVKIIPMIAKKKLKLVSLKDIPLLKNMVVCAIWGGSALLLAAVSSNISCCRPDILVIFGTFFICTLNSTIACDARDTEGDRIRQIFTLPVIIGQESTFRLLSLISIAGVLGIQTLWFTKTIEFPLAIFTTLCITWAWLSTVPLYRGILRLSKNSLEFVIDSHLMLAPFGLGLFYFL